MKINDRSPRTNKIYDVAGWVVTLEGQIFATTIQKIW